MKWLLRPSTLATAAALAVAAAAVFLLLPGPLDDKPNPPPVAAGNHEIAWLYYATGASAWQRFVEALEQATDRLNEARPDFPIAVDAKRAFPEETSDIPEVTLSLPPPGGSLVFRWCKLTTAWKTRDWVEALLKKGRRPPLAVIGGSNSDLARELAWQLAAVSGAVPPPDRPLLLLTTATADRVTDPFNSPERALAGLAASAVGLMASPSAPAPLLAVPAFISVRNEDFRSIDLVRIYPGRTFRFCFSNRQMAEAVMGFLWSQDELRPDANPVHVVQWDDDAYSRDLTDGFRQALPATAGLLNPNRVASSVGSFLTPNCFEADVVDQVLQDLDRNCDHQRRPLLVVTGDSAPSSRFLRELARTAPDLARRLVVATGDAVSFNTVYRDRRVTWPIQDLPFTFVFFCHYNPIDPEAGFRPETEGPGEGEDDRPTSTTGTEDVLLNRDVVEALVQAFDRDGQPAADAAELGGRLTAMRRMHGHVGFDPTGVFLFGPDGNRHGAAGEHVVCLRPRFQGDRVVPNGAGWQGSSSSAQRPLLEGDRILPEASIEVWVSRASVDAEQPWRCPRGPLKVSYQPPVVEERLGP